MIIINENNEVPYDGATVCSRFGALENTSGDMRMLSDLQLIYMVPRWQESWPFSDNNTKIL